MAGIPRLGGRFAGKTFALFRKTSRREWNVRTRLLPGSSPICPISGALRLFDPTRIKTGRNRDGLAPPTPKNARQKGSPRNLVRATPISPRAEL
jgi:hypothetical protein